LNKITRRAALKAFGLVAGVPVLTQLKLPTELLRDTKPSFQFIAVGPLPPPPFPAYASLVLRGYASHGDAPSGLITAVVASGYPPTEGAPVFPRTSIVASVREIQLGKTIEIKTRLDDAADLSHLREPRAFDVSIDKEAQNVIVNLRGSTVRLGLTEFRGSQ